MQQTAWFIVIESLGAWWVDFEGKPYGPFEDEAAALEGAKRVSSAFGDSSRESRVLVRGSDGRHHWEDTAAA